MTQGSESDEGYIAWARPSNASMYGQDRTGERVATRRAAEPKGYCSTPRRRPKNSRLRTPRVQNHQENTIGFGNSCIGFALAHTVRVLIQIRILRISIRHPHWQPHKLSRRFTAVNELRTTSEEPTHHNAAATVSTYSVHTQPLCHSNTCP